MHCVYLCALRPFHDLAQNKIGVEELGVLHDFGLPMKPCAQLYQWML